MKPVVVADHVGKQHVLGARLGYMTLRDSIMMAIRRQRGNRRPETIWALRDVSFSLGPGEVVGVIGRNGAGKSTLLKILSRITRPTIGEVRINGSVGSLLEVGSGFHHELTGRENIYLNGAFLGMRAKEITRRFDEIVAFAGVDRFIDTPVKHYSSGMYLRLAFSVAAHLDTEILLMDEVLAVGDLTFQRKCLGKMEEIGRSGRTVLFVSHNVNAVNALCPRTILIKDGLIAADGPSADVIGSYLSEDHGPGPAREWPSVETAPGNDVVRLMGVRVKNHGGAIASVVDIRKSVEIELEFEVLRSGQVLVPNLQFYNQDGTCAFMSAELDGAWRRRPRLAGRYVAAATVPGNFLAEGTLIVGAAVNTMDPLHVHVHVRDAVAFQVVDSFAGDTARGDYGGPMPGVLRPVLNWETRLTPDGIAAFPPPASFAERRR
jgi:lipopolysaccharide transport system ATP-binding protein